ncbi:LysR family transcriptional regulator [Ureibacillus chungkukjangi]|uniref:LysR family transcriptional regulator n=1 Tax=Ureibacillus chungkukjangi TaxID=1202712 RepID=UPI00203F09FF|nr:LysR family transcriptional regulator [Ureibacillus chungkukjangi]MCM3387822.1 LysR family transcriptional regulator [Ureibacillus chungkukjangi]
METKWLKSFVVAGKTENFREAAEILYISQPSITVHIHQLEDYLQIQLFKRESGKVALTEEGKFFLTEAEEILNKIEQGKQNLKLFSEKKNVKLTIVISPMLVDSTIPQIIYQFIIENPSYEVTLMVEESERIGSLLQSGQAHIGIGLTPSNSEFIQDELIHTSPLEFVVPLDQYDDETGVNFDIHELFRTYPFFTNHISSIFPSINLLVKNHFHYVKPISIPQSYIVKRFIKDGLGISFLPKLIIRREMMEGRFNVIPFTEFELPSVKIYMQYKLNDKKTLLIREKLLSSYLV